MAGSPDEQQKLTLKQRKWLQLYMELGNATEAAWQVYDCKDRESAAQIGYENLGKLDISEAMEEALLTDKLLLDKLYDGLSSGKQLSARAGKDANAETDDFIEVPDYATRHKYLETALKMKKRLIDRKDITSDDQPLKLDIGSVLTKVYGDQSTAADEVLTDR